jgi:DNA-binding NtrC family response regulator
MQTTYLTGELAGNSSEELKSAFLIPVSSQGLNPFPVAEFAVLGRDPQCSVALTDAYVSARHARIELKNGAYILRDLQSRNGTFVNESRITEIYLSKNDRIRVGETIFLFSDEIKGGSHLTSKNISWAEQLRRLVSFSSCDFPVLITGPSGSGKEVMARALHDMSSRASGNFVSINCSALSESLIESELFGHIKGSFTGATHDRKGAFEAARGGTLFLDEIGDLPMSLQPKLLRALENQEIRPVGSDRIIITNVRIVAATHQKLVRQIDLGKFREDLYYRLNVCRIEPPALVQRMEDFDDLLYHFARKMRVRFSFNAILKLKEHSWPGNVRELRNVVARAAAYFPGDHILPEHISKLIDPLPSRPDASAAGSSLGINTNNGISAPGTRGNVLREIERDLIVSRLVANHGNQRRTANDLGIPKSTLHDRMKTYHIELDRLRHEAAETI